VYIVGSAALKLGGSGGAKIPPGAPQHTMPQDVGMLPVALLSQVKSGVTLDFMRNVLALGLAMIQRTFGPLFVTLPHPVTLFTAEGPPRSSIRTCELPPSA